MLRSAAKNYRHSAVIVNPDRYPAIIEEMRQCGRLPVGGDLLRARARGIPPHVRVRCRDCRLSRAGRRPGRGVPSPASPGAEEGAGPPLRRESSSAGRAVRHVRQLVREAARQGALVQQYCGHQPRPRCSLRSSTSRPLPSSSTRIRAVSGRQQRWPKRTPRHLPPTRQSPFGGIVAVNRPLDMDAAERINEIFTEVIIAPEFPGSRARVSAEEEGPAPDAPAPPISAAGPGLRHPERPRRISCAGAATRGRQEQEEFRVVTRRTPTQDRDRGTAVRLARGQACEVECHCLCRVPTGRSASGPDRCRAWTRPGLRP